MKKGLIWGIVVVLVLISLSFYNFGEKNERGLVERAFDKDTVAPGEVVGVELNIELGKGQNYYIVEEIIPEGFVVLDDVAKGNKIRLVKIQLAKSTIFNYEVRAPSERGVYVFSGGYGMELVNGTRDIGGSNSIRVE